ncbi:MAG: DUF4340 domain-containing protein [Bryobacteraceae bacterium]|nr:DUF4340 domain-containing protein [Bryobacterales bacterium]NUN02495.1 DUF4340 domain-containing protein [Bryobacteraceae bacterium]
MRETLKTSAFVGAALALVLAAGIVEPDTVTPKILDDQGEAFYPNFTDPKAPKTIEVIDYDEETATARPLKVQFEKGRWVIASHHNYPVDAGDRLAKTAGALVDLRKDIVRSDSPQDHAELGVVDPLDQKVASLTGRGKRVTLRDEHGAVLADYVFGKPVEGKEGFRYIRVPGEKRTYAVKTAADPSARFADWVDPNLLRIAASSIRKVTVHSYTIDEMIGRLVNAASIILTREDGRWRASGDANPSKQVINEMVSTLDSLKVVDVRPKPPSLAQDLRKGQLQLSLETAVSLRQRGFMLSPTGRILANDGEMAVETSDGLVYTLRFGEVATGGPDSRPAAGAMENRHLFVTAHYRPQSPEAGTAAGERRARSLNERFADWYFIIRGQDVQRLKMQKATLVSGVAQPKPEL